jgi:hypothetical protein
MLSAIGVPVHKEKFAPEAISPQGATYFCSYHAASNNSDDHLEIL